MKKSERKRRRRRRKNGRCVNQDAINTKRKLSGKTNDFFQTMNSKLTKLAKRLQRLIDSSKRRLKDGKYLKMSKITKTIYDEANKREESSTLHSVRISLKITPIIENENFETFHRRMVLRKVTWRSVYSTATLGAETAYLRDLLTSEASFNEDDTYTKKSVLRSGTSLICVEARVEKCDSSEYGEYSEDGGDGRGDEDSEYSEYDEGQRGRRWGQRGWRRRQEWRVAGEETARCTKTQNTKNKLGARNKRFF